MTDTETHVQTNQQRFSTSLEILWQTSKHELTLPTPVSSLPAIRRCNSAGSGGACLWSPLANPCDAATVAASSPWDPRRFLRCGDEPFRFSFWEALKSYENCTLLSSVARSAVTNPAYYWPRAKVSTSRTWGWSRV